MDKKAVKEFMYGGIAELIKNRDYYYRSSVGASYSHWTEAGQNALTEYMAIVGYKMIEVEEAELDARAKAIVMEGLKS
jgi:hypothetical protein